MNSTLIRAAGRALVVMVVAGLAASALAQTYPARPVRVVVPFTAGSQTDVTMRLIGQKLAEMWGQQVVIDNRGGAGGTLGATIVAEATADGYTLLSHSNAYAVTPALYPKWKVDMLRDFQGVSTLASTPHLLIISPKLGPQNLKDFLEHARKLGDKFNWSSAGVGSGTHFCGEIFMLAAKLKHTHIPYKGTPEAMVDAVTGRVNVFFAPLGTAVPFLKDGRGLGIAVTSKERNPAIPNIPTVAESGFPGFDVALWFILAAPAKTPKDIVHKLNGDVRKVLALPEVTKAFEVTGVVTIPRSAEETQKFVASEIKIYAEVTKTANIPTF